MAQAVMLPFPAPLVWTPVFDGVGAMFVRCDNDPDVQAERIPGLTWVAPKLTGADITDRPTIESWMQRMRARGLRVGGWIYNEEPAADVASVIPWLTQIDFIIWDVEVPYKEDETPGGYAKAAELVTAWQKISQSPAAVTSYGGYKTSIDFGSFAKAGWPIFPQGYDSFTPADAVTYAIANGGPYPDHAIHPLVRSLKLVPGTAVYRPESIDP